MGFFSKPSATSTPSSELDSLVCARVKKLQRQRGWVRYLLWYIWQWFFIGPRAEIAHEVQLAQGFAERTKERILKEPTPSELDKGNLVDVLALLECARKETDFAQAWSYVNLADAILPLIVTEEELPACVSRLQAADDRLPDEYREELKKHLSADETVSLLGNVDAWLTKHKPHPPEAAHSDLQERVKKVTAGTDLLPRFPARDDRYAEQLVRTVLWNGVNRKISLKLSLWASIRRGLLSALLALFTAIALWTYQHQHQDCPWDKLLSFVEIGLLGLFGGMLSAFLTAREEDVNVPSYQVVVSRTKLRMLLGAAGAVVMYGVGLRLLSEKLQALIETDLFAFMTVGIVAGFSERLFIDTLERAASNLHTSGSPTQDEDKGKTSHRTTRRRADSNRPPKVEKDDGQAEVPAEEHGARRKIKVP
jgi:hypothetical protein